MAIKSPHLPNESYSVRVESRKCVNIPTQNRLFILVPFSFFLFCSFKSLTFLLWSITSCCNRLTVLSVVFLDVPFPFFVLSIASSSVTLASVFSFSRVSWDGFSRTVTRTCRIGLVEELHKNVLLKNHKVGAFVKRLLFSFQIRRSLKYNAKQIGQRD